MSPDDFKANSNYQADNKKNTPVVTGSVTRKQKSLVKKFTDYFFDDMTFSEAIGAFVTERLLPDLWDGIYNVCDGLLETMFYHRTRSSKGKRSSGNSNFTNYTSYQNQNRGSGSNFKSTSSRVANNFDDIIFSSRVDAENVLNSMKEHLEQYHRVTIGDFYDYSGITRNGFTDDYWGWTDLERAYPCRGQGAWVLNLPKPVELPR